MIINCCLTSAMFMKKTSLQTIYVIGKKVSLYSGTVDGKQQLEKTEGAMKNGQSREACQHWVHRRRQHIKLKRATRTPPNTGGELMWPAKGQQILPLMQHPPCYSQSIRVRHHNTQTNTDNIRNVDCHRKYRDVFIIQDQK